MMNFKMIFVVLMLTVSAMVIAQTKKVVVVAFYADKQISLKDIGLEALSLVTDLRNDPNFNLTPLVQQFHHRFFNDYAKKFPFELLPEATVTANASYQSFKPEFEPGDEATRYATVAGY